MPHVTRRSEITKRDPDAAVAICEALGIAPNTCSGIDIKITAPGTFRVQVTHWATEPEAADIAACFKAMGHGAPHD